MKGRRWEDIKRSRSRSPKLLIVSHGCRNRATSWRIKAFIFFKCQEQNFNTGPCVGALAKLFKITFHLSLGDTVPSVFVAAGQVHSECIVEERREK